MTKDEYIETLVENAQPYYQVQTRLLAEKLYELGVEEGKPKRRARQPYDKGTVYKGKATGVATFGSKDAAAETEPENDA